MTTDERQRALSFAVKRVVTTLESWDEPWRDGDDRARIPEYLEWKLLKESFNDWPDVRAALLLESDSNLRSALSQEQPTSGEQPVKESSGSVLARVVLKQLGIDAAEGSQLFADLTVDMEKVQLGVHRMMEGRSNGDAAGQEKFKAYYRRLGHLPSEQDSAVAPTPQINVAWEEYSSEKMSGPKPAWTDKTARSQEATFAEFCEIVGNTPVREITRDVMLKYRNVVARLPSNRQKKYPGKSIQELLEMDVAADQLLSNRTISEKLIRLGAFLKWSRDIKGYLSTDPLRGLHVEHESQSYAPFNSADLRKLFNSSDYERGGHSRSWRYWLPLIALYAGARQTEIAQLLVRNVVEEDGVWMLVITDDDGQKVKTSAGVRKVPISSKLIALGFLDYVAFLKERGETRLFPDLKTGRDGYGHYVSRWFNEDYKQSVGIEPDPTGKRKVFHSFRHSAITRALGAGQPLAHVQQVFGHEKSLLGESATYTHEFPVASLVPVIEALDYGLDHSGYAKTWRDYVADWPAAATPPAQSVSRTSARVKRAA